MKYMKILCRVFGHSADPVDLALEKIKMDAVSEHEVGEVKCRRCGESLV